MKESLSVLLVGFGVVFIGLLSLIGIIYAMSFIVRLVRHEERAPRKRGSRVVLPGPEGFVPPVGHSEAADKLTGANRREIVAAVSAAIAESIGADVSGIRIKSIRRVGAPGQVSVNDRRELVAVISAAIAEELGTDVNGIRILSIRKTV